MERRPWTCGGVVMFSMTWRQLRLYHDHRTTLLSQAGTCRARLTIALFAVQHTSPLSPYWPATSTASTAAHCHGRRPWLQTRIMLMQLPSSVQYYLQPQTMRKMTFIAKVCNIRERVSSNDAGQDSKAQPAANIDQTTPP